MHLFTTFTVEADVLVTKAGSNLQLTCDGGPDSAVMTWQIDGVPADQAGLDNVFVTYDKSLLVQNIGEFFFFFFFFFFL